VDEKETRVSSPAERAKTLEIIAKGAMQGLSIANLCNHPQWRAFKITPEEVEAEVKRLGGTIPEEPPQARVNRWIGKLEMAKFTGVVLACVFLFPYLPGITFSGTLVNALIVTVGVYIVHYLFIAICTLILVPALLLVVGSGGDVVKVIKDNEKLAGLFLSICGGFFYPAFTIALLSKVCPALITVTSWQGLLLAAGTIGIIFNLFTWIFPKLVRYPSGSIDTSS